MHVLDDEADGVGAAEGEPVRAGTRAVVNSGAVAEDQALVLIAPLPGDDVSAKAQTRYVQETCSAAVGAPTGTLPAGLPSSTPSTALIKAENGTPMSDPSDAALSRIMPSRTVQSPATVSTN